MPTITLNETEREVLFRQDPATKTEGGWQSLLVSLQEQVDAQTGSLTLTDAMLHRIQNYAFAYGQGGWEDRLLQIFARTLGPRLDGNV